MSIVFDKLYMVRSSLVGRLSGTVVKVEKLKEVLRQYPDAICEVLKKNK